MTIGDYEPADSYDADPTIAPEQVAARIHRIRCDFIELAGGRRPGELAELDPESQEVAAAFGSIVVDWLHTEGPR